MFFIFRLNAFKRERDSSGLDRTGQERVLSRARQGDIGSHKALYKAMQGLERRLNGLGSPFKAFNRCI